MRLLPDAIAIRYENMTPGRRRWVVIASFILVQALIWVLLEAIYFQDRPITDTSIYYAYANRIVSDGLFPYADFAVEYPPVAMLIFLLPRLLSGMSYNMYVYWFEVEMFLFSCGNILLVGALAWRRWRDTGRLAAALGLYTLFTAMAGFIIPARFDIAAAFLILATLAAFIYDRKLIAWLLVGAGIMTKVVPLFLAPLFLIAHYRSGQRDWLFKGPVAALVAAAVIAVPFLAVSWEGLTRSFLYHAERPLQIESTWSTLLLFASYMGYGLRMFLSYGSHNLFTPLANLLATLSGPVTLLFLLVGYRSFWLRLRERDDGRENDFYREDQLMRYAAATVVIFMAGGKVLSPQFLIWLVPLVPLIYDGDRNYIITLTGALLVLTQVEFPFLYGELLARDPVAVTVVAVRNVLLIWLAVVLVRRPIPREGLFGMHRLEGADTRNRPLGAAR